ncbi:MAG: hypothetical protein L6R39_003590 [Caloplaca ligustica]|nr:MAG: hypothetical protein L6R39_003590 [Caloplaca ligustica]
MSREQLSQHNPADVAPASAQDSHGPPGPSHRVNKQPSVQGGVDLSTSKDSSTPHFPTSALTVPTDGSKSATTPTSPPSDDQALNERNLAHETALRRLNGLDSQPKRGRKAPDLPSTASTQPVLVREYSQSTPNNRGSRQSIMKQRSHSRSNRESSEMPPLESFSFHDILASIDPQVHGSIDKIAEICGRSRMSLADEYSSHLPPHGDFSLLNLQDHGDHTAVSRLEPVEEASSTHEESAQEARSTPSRAARLSLVGRPNTGQGDLSSAPVTATSNVASHTQSVHVRPESRAPEVQASYIPQLLAWLGSSQHNSSRLSNTSRGDSGAANALLRILDSSAESTIN